MLPSTDGRLVRLAAAGSPEAFSAIYSLYQAPLHAYCRSILRDEHDASDAVQTTMLKALTAVRRGGGTIALRPWLFRIAHNESISALRTRPGHSELAEETAASERGLDDALLERERLRQLLSDIEGLSERQRGALLMREMAGLGYGEIAVALDITQGAARQAVFEARAQLMAAAEGHDLACEHIRSMLAGGDGRGRRAVRLRAHLRTCPGCRAFDAGRARRRHDLGLLPALWGAGTAAAAGGGLMAAGTGAGAATGTGMLAKLAAGALAVVAGAGTVEAARASLRLGGPRRSTPRDPRGTSPRPPRGPLPHRRGRRGGPCSSSRRRRPRLRSGPRRPRPSRPLRPPRPPRPNAAPQSPASHGRPVAQRAARHPPSGRTAASEEKG